MIPMDIKATANKRIVIRTKYILNRDEEIQLATLIKRFCQIVNSLSGESLAKALPAKMRTIVEGNPTPFTIITNSFKDTIFSLEDEEKESRIYTLYVFTLIPTHIIDYLLKTHANKLKKSFRFIESAEAVL